MTENVFIVITPGIKCVSKIFVCKLSFLLLTMGRNSVHLILKFKVGIKKKEYESIFILKKLTQNAKRMNYNEIS